MKTIVLAHFITFSLVSLAQTDWEKHYILSDHGVNNSVESVYGTLELPDGSYLIGGTANVPSPTAYVANIASNGDSLWVRYYDASYCGFSRCADLYYNNAGELYGVFEPLYGKMSFVKLDGSSGDTLSRFFNPHGDASGWHYFDHVELANGDYILAYTQGSGSTAGSIERFTPGAASPQWNNDYASAVIAPSSIILDGSAVVATGYCGGANWTFDMCAVKLNLDGSEIFRKKYIRGSFYRDTPCGIGKNSAGNYLLSGSWAGAGGIVFPSVITIDGNTGDSLHTAMLSSANAQNVNFGFVDKLVAGNNFFVGVGEVDKNVTDPDGGTQNVGYMAAFIIDDNGNFGQTYLYNDLAPYFTNPGYASCSDWAYDALMTSTNDILVSGRGNYSYVNASNTVVHSSDSYLVSINGGSLGLKTYTIGALTTWPNPSTGNFHLSNTEAGELSIFDLTGKKVYLQHVDEPNALIVTGDLAPGMYTLNFGNDIQILSSGRIIIR